MKNMSNTAPFVITSSFCGNNTQNDVVFPIGLN